MDEMPMVSPSRCLMCEVKDSKIVGLQRELAASQDREKRLREALEDAPCYQCRYLIGFKGERKMPCDVCRDARAALEAAKEATNGE